MSLYYTLDENHNPVPTEDILVWRRFREKHKRVALDHLPDCWLSTVFLGIDYGDGEGPPILFETMAKYDDPEFGEELLQERYATWDEAVAGHARILEELKNRTALTQEAPHDT